MVSEKEFNPKTQVKEFKRTCNECGKVWHSLAGREKKINDDIKNNACSQCAFCGNPGAQLQAKRNVEAGESELERLKKCPDCSSGNYKEEVV
ncbi:MAG: hypothetical protein ABH850_03025, partial [Candidatus Micrarchaeota archaeon]